MQVSKRLYREHADALVAQGFLSAGYNAIHVDDCWERKEDTHWAPGLPSDMKALGDDYHSKGVKNGLYTAESTTPLATTFIITLCEDQTLSIILLLCILHFNRGPDVIGVRTYAR